MRKENTKMFITLGPAINNKTTLLKMLSLGVDGFRINFSHGTLAEHTEIVKILNEIRRETEYSFALMGDLQGPKIRLGEVEPQILKKNQKIKLSQNANFTDGLHVNYNNFLNLLKVGHMLYINDGLVKLKVTSIKKNFAEAIVLTSGPISSHKGINIPDVRSRFPVLDKKDLTDLAFLVSNNFDYVALSFVRGHKDLIYLQKKINTLTQNPENIKIIAKIEKPEAVKDIDNIFPLCDGVIVARGDLGIEMELDTVTLVQKEIALKGFEFNKPVMTATQMLESMINNALPTRAEVADITNAVLDGCDALLLTGETSIGKHPIEAVKFMKKIITKIEKSHFYTTSVASKISFHIEKTTIAKSIGYSIYNMVQTLDHVKAIVAYTFSGFTALSISKYQPNIPILGLSPNEKTLNFLNLYNGVEPAYFPFKEYFSELVEEAEELILKKKIAKKGDTIIITAGHPLQKRGITNLIKIHTIEQKRK